MAVLKNLRSRIRNHKANSNKETERLRKEFEEARDNEAKPLDDFVSPGGSYLHPVPRRDSPHLFDDNSESTTSSWVSCESLNYHQHSPLVARPRPTLPPSPSGSSATCTTEGCIEEEDEVAELGLVMARSRNLPGTWYYSSIHILINRERVKRNIPPMTRHTELDSLARSIADDMAADKEVRHSDPDDVLCELEGPSRRVGENVARGPNIRDIHQFMMNKNVADKNNILDRRYRFMGCATAFDSDGRLYMCQIFRG